MAFLCFIGGIAAFFVVFFDSFGISCFFKLFHFLSMLFSLFSYFSVSLRSLLRPMWQHSVEHSWIHSLLFSFLSVFHWHAINEHANLTFSRSFSFFYIGGKEPLGSKHSTFSHNIDRVNSVVTTPNENGLFNRYFLFLTANPMRIDSLQDISLTCHPPSIMLT